MKRSMLIGLSLFTFCLLFHADVSSAEDWGTLKGRFVFDGKAPTPAKVVPEKDPAFCGKFNLIDETLVVSKEGGIKNIVVWLDPRSKVEIHPDYDKIATTPVSLANKNCRYEPRICLLWTKQTLELSNPDGVSHNTNIKPFKNKGFNSIIPIGGKLPLNMPLAESVAAPVECNIHPWMKAYLIVKDNPYFAKTDAEGNFEIKNIPEGKLRFRFWHEKNGYVKKVNLNGKSTSWRFGRTTFDIKTGKTTDLGTIKVKL